MHNNDLIVMNEIKKNTKQVLRQGRKKQGMNKLQGK